MRDQSITEDSSIASSHGPDRPAWWRRNLTWLIPVGIFVVLLMITTVVFSFWRTDDVAVRPGSVDPVPSRVTVSGADVYPPSNEISLVTVLVSQRLTILERIGAEFESGIDIEPERIFVGDGTRQELRQLNELRMTSSQEVASVVALEHLGYEIPYISSGVIVVETMGDTPASTTLEWGDVIVGIEGTPVTDLGDLAEALAVRQAGETVSLSVEQAGSGLVEQVELELVGADDGSGRVLIGVSAQERTDIGELPVDILVDSGNTGGPSAGLALTLGIIDILTPGELAGDLKVATTGTIVIDGTVGPVGEVDQKAIAARRAGVDLFLVPELNLQEALDNAGDRMRVVAVTSLSEALDVLAESGGEPVEAESSGQR